MTDLHAVPDPLPDMPPPAGQLRCSRCGEHKPTDEFPRDAGRPTGRDVWCSACRRTWGAEYRAANPQVTHKARLRRYGLTPDDFARLMAAQGGKCAICSATVGGGNGDGETLHVDHNHATGTVRGLLCSPCNVGLSRFRDNPMLLGAAIFYLAHPPAVAALRDEHLRMVTPCAGCGGMLDPDEWEGRHTDHSPDCLAGVVAFCTCDVNYHADCCPCT